MTEKRQQILDSSQIQSALEVMRAYLAAPTDADGRTPMEIETEMDQDRVRLIETELKPLIRSCCTTQFRPNRINNLAGLCNTL